MVFLSYLQSDINLVYIRDLKIECRARPLTRRGKEEGFHVEIESPCDLFEKVMGSLNVSQHFLCIVPTFLLLYCLLVQLDM